MASLSEIMKALQDIADAVARDDESRFRTAVKHAENIGCTEEQIRDAYDYRNKIRREPVSFPFQR